MIPALPVSSGSVDDDMIVLDDYHDEDTAANGATALPVQAQDLGDNRGSPPSKAKDVQLDKNEDNHEQRQLSDPGLRQAMALLASMPPNERAYVIFLNKDRGEGDENKKESKEKEKDDSELEEDVQEFHTPPSSPSPKPNPIQTSFLIERHQNDEDHHEDIFYSPYASPVTSRRPTSIDDAQSPPSSPVSYLRQGKEDPACGLKKIMPTPSTAPPTSNDADDGCTSMAPDVGAATSTSSASSSPIAAKEDQQKEEAEQSLLEKLRGIQLIYQEDILLTQLEFRVSLSEGGRSNSWGDVWDDCARFEVFVLLESANSLRVFSAVPLGRSSSIAFEPHNPFVADGNIIHDRPVVHGRRDGALFREEVSEATVMVCNIPTNLLLDDAHHESSPPLFSVADLEEVYFLTESHGCSEVDRGLIVERARAMDAVLQDSRRVLRCEDTDLVLQDCGRGGSAAATRNTGPPESEVVSSGASRSRQASKKARVRELRVLVRVHALRGCAPSWVPFELQGLIHMQKADIANDLFRMD
ncbi:unnamed protein product [Amoebophrya sp. A25]|nr:unnamed protein product [Amoebophrya sp. A25]|eukprot:GSA25T00002449001.1